MKTENKLDSRLILAVVASVLVAFTSSSHASIWGLTGPATSSTGTYALTWDDAGLNCGSEYYSLTENSLQIYQGCNLSFNVTGNPSGTYSYDIEACIDAGEFVGIICIPDGGISVVVSTQAPQPTIDSFDLTPSNTIWDFEPITAIWTATDADSCGVQGDPVQYSYPSTNSVNYPGNTFAPGNYTYNFVCTGPGGASAPFPISLVVKDSSLPAELLSFEITNTNDTIYENQWLHVNWESDLANDCYNLGDTEGWGASGDSDIPPNSFSPGVYSYSFYCSGPGGDSAVTTLSLTVLKAYVGFDEEYKVYSDGTTDSLLVIRNQNNGYFQAVNEFKLEKDTSTSAPHYYKLNNTVDSNDLVTHTTPVTYALNDFNVDGLVDLVIVGIEVPNTELQDTIVYADTAAGLAPQAIKGIDQDFKDFFTQISGFIANPDYFEDKAWEALSFTYTKSQTETWQSWPAWYLSLFQFMHPGDSQLEYLDDPNDWSNSSITPNGCGVEIGGFTLTCNYASAEEGWMVYTRASTVTIHYDYSIFNQTARDLAAVFFDMLSYGGLAPNAPGIDLVGGIMGVNNLLSAVTLDGTTYPPDTVYDGVNLPKWLAEALFRIIKGVGVTATAVTWGWWDNDPFTDFYHYTNDANVIPIEATGELRSFKPNDPFVYFATEKFLTGRRAKSKLAMEVRPDGYYVFRSDGQSASIGPFAFTGFPVYKGKVEEEYGESGGGHEFVLPNPVPLSSGIGRRAFYVQFGVSNFIEGMRF